MLLQGYGLKSTSPDRLNTSKVDMQTSHQKVAGIASLPENHEQLHQQRKLQTQRLFEDHLRQRIFELSTLRQGWKAGLGEPVHPHILMMMHLLVPALAPTSPHLTPLLSGGLRLDWAWIGRPLPADSAHSRPPFVSWEDFRVAHGELLGIRHATVKISATEPFLSMADVQFCPNPGRTQKKQGTDVVHQHIVWNTQNIDEWGWLLGCLRRKMQAQRELQAA